MQRVLTVLNSPIILLVAGALITGLLVNAITRGWQQEEWLFQQRFTAERAKFDRQLEARYKLLEDVNLAVADVLTHSQQVAVGQQKGVKDEQRNEIMRAYNEAQQKWEANHRLYLIRLKTLFVDPELAAKWDAIKKSRDDLDVAIYSMTQNGSVTPKQCLKLIDGIVRASEELSQRMLAAINAQQAVR